MKKITSILLFALISVSTSLFAQKTRNGEALAHTYSIVAIDKESGQMAVAVQSHWFSVGTIVSWGEAGVGVVATQSFVNASFGPRGLALLKEGKSPRQALDILLSDDEGREVRQVAILNTKGEVAVHTGSKCIDYAGHIKGDGFSVQANMMLTNKVWPAMAEAFETHKHLPLAERVIKTFEAAEQTGGDIRGKQSAALLIVPIEATGKAWEGKLIDLRVDDGDEPVKELARLLKVHRAYEHMNNGDLAVEKSDMEGASKEYRAAEDLFPDNLEMKYWHAITLLENGQNKKSIPMLKAIFKKDENWKELTKRLPKVGLLNISEKELQALIE